MRDASTVAAMPCPVCKTGLALSDRQGVEIDYCPQCRGVWLDRGELDKIIERSAAQVTPPPGQFAATTSVPPTPYRPDRSHGAYPRKRKKSFLEELFD